MTKRIVSLALILSMVMSLIVTMPITAGAATSDIYTYTVSDGKATITDCDESVSGDITIPSTLSGCPVTCIGDYAFWDCHRLTSITLPDSVTTIGNSAFSHCESLTGIVIPDSVTSIGEGAFWGCESLADISIPNGIVNIEDYTFYRCINLVSINIPNSVIRIGNHSFSYCSRLKTITLPNKLINIGTEAFISCESIETLTIPRTINNIGEDAFRWCDGLTGVIFSYGITNIGNYFSGCDGLKSIVIPHSVIRIEEGAFQTCTSLKNVYYTGSANQWSNIEINMPNYFLVHCTIHYNYKLPGSEAGDDNNNDNDSGNSGSDGSDDDFEINYIPNSVNNVVINGRGTAYGWFKVKTTGGAAAANRTVSYTVDNGVKRTTKANEHGIMCIEVKNVTSSKDYNIAFSGDGIAPSTGVLSVTVEPLHFKSNYEAAITLGANAGIGLGVGGSLGKFKAEATIAEASIGGSGTRSLEVSQEVINNKNKLEITTKRNLDGAMEAKAGLFANAGAWDNAKVEAALVKACGNVGYGSVAGVGFEDDDFNIHNKSDLLNVSLFLIRALLDGTTSNAVTRYIVDKLDGVVNSYETGNVATLGAGAEAGVVEGNVGAVGGGVTLGGIGADSVWSNSIKVNSDKTKEYTSGISTASNYKIIGAKVKGIGQTLNVSTEFPVFGKNGGNNYELFAKENTNGLLNNIGFSVTQSNSNQILFYKTTTSEVDKISFNGNAADAVANSSDSLADFSNGLKGFFSVGQMRNSIDSMLNSDNTGTYSSSVKKEKGVDIDISASVQLLAELGGKIGISGVESYEYDAQNGIYENNTVYIQNVNNIKDVVANNFFGVEDMMELAADAMTQTISSLWTSVKGAVSDAANSIVEAGNAIIKGIGNGAKKLYVTIFKPTEQVSTMSVLAVEDEVSLFSTSSLATTIGEPYIVKVEDEDGNVLTDFTDNPLMLTLSYTQADLDEAGVTDLSDISILHWDDDKCVYVYAGGTLDSANSCLSLEITKPGQYILAADNCPPAITLFQPSDSGKTPEISATVSDMSGIAEFTFKIDGGEVLNTDTFEEYYDFTTGKFAYRTAELTEGTHTATIYAADSLGNSLEEEIEFTVSTAIPEISAVTVIPEILSGETEVLATVSDDNLAHVFLNVEVTDAFGNSTLLSEEMAEQNGTFIANTPSIPDGYTVKTWVSAYNSYGNKAESDKQNSIALASDTILAITKVEKGSVTVTCTDSTADGKIYLASYDGDGTLEYSDFKKAASSVTFDNVPLNGHIRAFMWNGMTPVGKASDIVDCP